MNIRHRYNHKLEELNSSGRAWHDGGMEYYLVYLPGRT